MAFYKHTAVFARRGLGDVLGDCAGLGLLGVA